MIQTAGQHVWHQSVLDYLKPASHGRWRVSAGDAVGSRYTNGSVVWGSFSDMKASYRRDAVVEYYW